MSEIETTTGAPEAEFLSGGLAETHLAGSADYWLSGGEGATGDTAKDKGKDEPKTATDDPMDAKTDPCCGGSGSPKDCL